MKPAALLNRPLQPDPLRRCPACRRVRALVAVDVRTHGEVTVTTYRCRCCGHEVQHGDRHPRGVI